MNVTTAARTLLRGPGDVGSSASRQAVVILILGGAALTVLSGIIHLRLWGETNGYRQLPTIGPLFLAQGIAGIVMGIVVAVTRWLVAVLAAAGMLIATIGGLLIAIEHGLFGFRESWQAPYVRTSLYEEIAGAVLLLIAAWLLASSARARGRR
jgi:hypothetical protein